jgi:hypothetical protein
MRNTSEIETGGSLADSFTPAPAGEDGTTNAVTSDDQKPQQGKGKSGGNGRPAREQVKPSAENFFNRLSQMTETDWDKHKLYVYRRWPRISRDDQPHYIGSHRQAIDEEFIKNMYGSGRYLLKLNDTKRTIDFTPLEIQDLAFPPKLSPDELMACPENERFHKLWPVDNQKASIAGGGDSAVKELTSLLKSVWMDKSRSEQKGESDALVKELVDWALRQKDQDRAESSPTALANLVKELKAILPTQSGPAADPLAIVDKVLAIQNRKETQTGDMEAVDRAWKLVERIQERTKPRAEEAYPLQALNKTMDLIGKIKETFKPEAPMVMSRDGGWEVVASNLIHAGGHKV